MTESNPPLTGSETAEPAHLVSVLLIDDQPIVGAAIRRLLSSETDISLQYCQDPTRAVAMAIELKPHVLLLDLVMPGLDGLSLLKSLRENPATTNTPVIVLSAKEDPKIKAAALDRGANDYLVKIPDKVELLARIRQHARNTDRITRKVTEQMRLLVQQMLEEFQYNMRALQEASTGKSVPVFRDQAWRALSSQLSLPGDLHSQVEAAYQQMRHANEINQGHSQASTIEKVHEVKTVLETVKELAPLLVQGLALLI
jgi:DNA-binding response OmpR family regulator